MPKKYAVWDNSVRIWDRMRSEVDEKDQWRGTLSSLFRELNMQPFQTKVTKGLILMNRIKYLYKAKKAGEQSVIQLYFPEAELSITEFSLISKELTSNHQQRVRTEVWQLEQRLNSMSDILGELQVAVAELQGRPTEPIDEDELGPPNDLDGIDWDGMDS